MSSRENILNSIKANKPDSVSELPTLPNYTSDLNTEELINAFKQYLGENAAVVKQYNTDEDATRLIVAQWQDQGHIHAPMFPYLHNSPGTVEASASVDIAVVVGSLGVINNGAIWVEDKNLEHRSVPFLTKYLVILLNKSDLVYTLHDAYAKLDPESFAYGVWISGPSKTGDIEQALVVGAHGPLEVLVLIKN